MSLPPDDLDATLEDELAAMRAASERRASLPPLPEVSMPELLPRTFVDAHAGHKSLRSRLAGEDPFGFDPAFAERMRPLINALYKDYFRLELRGAEHVPEHGRALLIANHAGTLPLDGPLLRHALQHDHTPPRDLRWLVEDTLFHMPHVGTTLNRLGAVRACQDNAERLLRDERVVAVFPEGIKGTGKLFRDRYQLQRFGRGGFVRLAQRTATPMLPVAILGSEETNPLLFRLSAPARRFGLPFLPITPTFPWLGPLGLLPLPVKWQIEIGAPIMPPSADAPLDDLDVAELTEHVRSTVQRMLQRMRRERTSVLRG